jgi:outer membrane protein insertion porin family
MRVQIIVILIMGMLVFPENQQALANSESADLKIETGVEKFTPNICTEQQNVCTRVESWQENQFSSGVVNNSSWETAKTADSLTSGTTLLAESFKQISGDKIVKDIQIRFVNNKGEWVDEKGRIIEGRTQKNFLIDNLKLKPGQIFSTDLFKKDVERLRRLNSFDKVNFGLEEDDTGVNIVY